MQITPFRLLLGGILSFACVADRGETCCPCQEDFHKAVCERAEQPAGEPATEILAFEATWCGPCQKMAPLLSKLEKQGLKIRRIDIDKNRALAQKFDVTSLPTLVKLVGGKEQGRIVGVSSVGQIKVLAGPDQGNAPEAACPQTCAGCNDCNRTAAEIPAAIEVDTLLRATYRVPADKAAALVGLLEQSSGFPMETKIDGDKLTITTTPAAQRTIGTFIHAFLRGSSDCSLSACSS